MTYWLATAASQLRVKGERKLVHVAAQLSRSESTLSRFEKHLSQPEDIDATVAAYSRDLGIAPIEIWTLALELWRADELSEAGDDRPTPVVDGLAARLGKAAESPPPPARVPQKSRRAATRRKTA